MAKIEMNVGKMEAQLQQWGAKLDDLVAKAGSEAKTDYQQLIDDLKTKYQLAQSRLDQLKAAGGEKMATFKDGMDSAWNEVEVAFQKLKGGGKDRSGQK
jgi:ElaB/YqjD/DUF883 family membrane-anchored ribosome-binding protein